jgi:serine/threonine protein kinase
MTPHRWRQVESLYHSALHLQAADREEFLIRACAGDNSLLHEVLSLLFSSDCADSFLEEPAVSLGLEVMGFEQEAMVGKLIDRYRLLEVLGRGGMGEVYLAHDPRLNRRVALKLLPASITGDRGRVLRFEQEARAASAISHPNVAHIYEIGEAQGQHYIVMEYIQGKTLRQILREGSLEVNKALTIAVQMMEALTEAHRVGVIHRDIKPENIMLRDDGYLKVLDFGLAKLNESGATGSDEKAQALSSLHTDPALLMGTSHYMSPEQVRRQHVDGRTDLWSVGVVFYEMLAGQRPFHGQAISEIIISILEQEPEPINHKLPGLPPALQHFVDKALRKQPDERYQTADSMLLDLRRIVRQLEDERNVPSPSSGNEPETPSYALRESAQITVESPGRLTEETGHSPEASKPFPAEKKENPASSHSFLAPNLWRTGIVVVALLSLLGIGLYLSLFSERWRKLKHRNFNLQFQRLNMSGSISDLVISPDGKYIASIVGEEGKQAVHILERATSSDLRIVAPSEKGYSGLSFSPDGNYVYYLENQTETANLYRVSKLGGAQRKILNNINTPVTFSPDGNLIAFVRLNIADDTPDLIISNADGTAERTLARRTRNDTDVFPVNMNGIGPAWSPDGKFLACATTNWSRNPKEMNLEIIDVATGASRRLNAMPWYDLSRIAWLADGSGIIVAATNSPSSLWQLSLLSFPDGAIRQLSRDPNNYTRISTTADSSLFLALNVEDSSSIWLISPEGEKQFTPFNVSQKKGVSEIVWKPDGKLIYTVNDGESLNLWMQEADGSSTRQLTFENKNFKPTISPDERYVVFVSSREGIANLWRMDTDGTQLKRLTFGQYEDMPSITPDGKWIIYRTGTSVMKIPVDGGKPVKLFDKTALYPVVSTDGQLLAYFTNQQPDSQRWHLEVLDLNSLTPVRSFDLSDAVKPFNGLRWTPDGQGLVFISSADGASNLWLQPLNGDAPRQLTNFKDAEILSFAWSANLKQIACVRSNKTFIPVLIKPF